MTIRFVKYERGETLLPLRRVRSVRVLLYRVEELFTAQKESFPYQRRGCTELVVQLIDSQHFRFRGVGNHDG